jgi:hypothetical protein
VADPVIEAVARALQFLRELGQTPRIGQQHLEVLGRGRVAKGLDNVVQRFWISGLGRVRLDPGRLGKGFCPGREMGKAVSIEALVATVCGLPPDEML